MEVFHVGSLVVPQQNARIVHTYDRIEREKIMSTSVPVLSTFFAFSRVFFFSFLFILTSLHTVNLQSVIVLGQLAKPSIRLY